MLLILGFLILAFSQDAPVIYKGYKNSQNQLAYTTSDTCPFLYTFDPDSSLIPGVLKWKMFCKYAQNVVTEDSTLLGAKVQTDEAKKLSENLIYSQHNCEINDIKYSDDGSYNCCCTNQILDNELTTEGLTAVIVVPIVFLIGGLIMFKLNSHNSRDAWKHEFEQIQL